MKTRTSFIRDKKVLKVISLLILFGFIISYFIYQNIDRTSILEELKNIKEYLNQGHINYFVLHFIIISLLITSSTLGLGVVLFPLYFLFEFFCLSFNIFSFYEAFKLNGIIFSLIYSLLTKGIYLFLMFLIYKKVLSIMRFIVSMFLNKSDGNLKYPIIKKLKGIIVAIFLIFLNDIFIYFVGHKILAKLVFIVN